MCKMNELITLSMITLIVIGGIDANNNLRYQEPIKEEVIIEKPKEEPKEEIIIETKIEIDNKTLEPFTISGLSAEGINERLKGTYLEGMGEVLYRVELEKGVNFRFIYGIGGLESGYGKHLAGKYNYFGLTCGGQYRGYQNFESKEKVLLYMGELLTNDLYKGKSIEQIARIYCPPNHEKWAKDVKFIMKEV